MAQTSFFHTVLYEKTELGLKMASHRCVGSVAIAVKTGIILLEDHNLQDEKCCRVVGRQCKASDALIIEAGEQIDDIDKDEFHVLVDMESYTLCIDERRVDIQE